MQRNIDDRRSRSAPYLVLSCIAGHNLRTELRVHGGRVPEALVTHWGCQLAEVSSGVHRTGVVHRDVKPENLIIDPAGDLHLIDFGDAGWIGKRGNRFAALTGLQGTPEYLSPEQILGWRPDPRNDLYSTGVVLYEALTGWPPTSARRPMTSSSTTSAAPLRTSARSARETSIAVACVVHELLRRRPEDRVADAAYAFWQDSTSGSETLPTRPSSSTGPTSRTSWTPRCAAIPPPAQPAGASSSWR